MQLLFASSVECGSDECDLCAGDIAAGGKGLANADAAILSGCSAGGLATYLHCDAFAGLVAPTPAKCVADAGYFANIPSLFGTPPVGQGNPRKSIIERVELVDRCSTAGFHSQVFGRRSRWSFVSLPQPALLCCFAYRYEYTWIFTHQQSNNSDIGVNQNCLAAIGRDNPLCFFPEYSLKYMKTPMFVLQSGCAYS